MRSRIKAAWRTSLSWRSFNSSRSSRRRTSARKRGRRLQPRCPSKTISMIRAIKGGPLASLSISLSLSLLLAIMCYCFKCSGEEDSSLRSKKKISKDPSVDTSFLPDLDRDRQLATQKEQLKQEWLTKQEQIKNEVLQLCLHIHSSHSSLCT